MTRALRMAGLYALLAWAYARLLSARLTRWRLRRRRASVERAWKQD